MKAKLFRIIFLATTTIGFAQYTLIPDINFENALSAYDDIANDGQVPTANINSVTYLDVNSQNISDLTGIQNFTALQYLRCYTNNLSSLDLTGLSNLLFLACSENQIPSLDLTSLTNLNHLECNNNQLTSLNVVGLANLQLLWFFDNEIDSIDLTGLSSLQSMVCFSNNLITIDVSGITSLEELICENNLLTSVNVSGASALQLLSCSYNLLTSLDASGLSNIDSINCYYNQLTSLDVSGLSNLESLICDNNQLTSLDLSESVNLYNLNCENNQLVNLNVKNGNNTNIDNSYFVAYNNPNLTCIYVDDASYSSTNWLNIDSGATFVETQAACDALSLDDETIAQSIQLYPNPTVNIINIKKTDGIKISQVVLTNMLGQILFNNKSVDKIDLTNFKQGVYFLKIEDEKGNQISYKIVKK